MPLPEPDQRSYPPAGDAACANCGLEAVGDFCSTCGQKHTPLRQPVRHFLADAFQEYFGLDGRLWASLKLLLFRPGALTRAYLEGHRVRYLRPLRLYLSATLLFFFLLSVFDPAETLRQSLSEQIEAEQIGMVRAADRVAMLDSTLAVLAVERAQGEALIDSLRARTDSLQQVLTGSEALDSLGIDLGDTFAAVGDLAETERRGQGVRWQRGQLAALPPDSLIDADAWVYAARALYAEESNINIDLPAWAPRSRSIERLAASRTNEEKSAAIADFARSALGQLPTVMFLLLPFFALVLKGVYFRREWYYSEHLVFALHTHAFAFTVFALIAMLIGFGGDVDWVTITVRLLFFSVPIYFFLAQKRVYGQSWLKTATKALMLAGLYGMALLGGMVLAIILAASV